MVDKEEISKYLLDSDGTTRDITFTPVAAERVRDFVDSLRAVYRVTKASDADGKNIASLFKTEWDDEKLSTSEGYMHAVFEAPGRLIPVLQVFIDWPMDHRGYGVELSFFPADLDSEAFRVDSFIALIEAWQCVLSADDYFVRYENASWDWYDANGLGVIYTGSQLRASQSS
jgi:hypothetical protein